MILSMAHQQKNTLKGLLGMVRMKEVEVIEVEFIIIAKVECYKGGDRNHIRSILSAMEDIINKGDHELIDSYTNIEEESEEDDI